MERIFLQLSPDDTVKARLNSARVPGAGPNLPSDFIEVSNTPFPPGITDWDEVLDHTYDVGDGSFTPPTIPPLTSDETRLATLEADNVAEDANVDTLLANSTWNAVDRDNAQRIILRQSAIVDLKNRLVR